MAKQMLINLEPNLDHRTKINENFTELYDFNDTVVQNYSLNEIHVDGNVGSDSTGDGKISNPYATIKFALASILDNDSTHRYVIKIAPNVYNEVNPLTLKSFVTLKGSGDVQIIPTDVNSVMFTGADTTTLENFTISGVTNNTAINYVNSGRALIRDVLVLNSLNGVVVNNAGLNLSIFTLNFSMPVGSADSMLTCLAGFVTLRSSTVGGGSVITDVIKANGANAFINVNGFTSLGANSTNVFYADNGGSIFFSTISISDSANGLRADNGSVLKGAGFVIANSTLFDIIQDDVASVIDIISGEINFNKVSISDWSNVLLEVISRETGEQLSVTTSEKHVGIPEQGYETALGEGDSTSRGNLVYTFDGADYTNETVAAQSISGSTFTFPTTVNSGMYLSWDLLQNAEFKKFYGLKIKIDGATSIGAGAFVWEYWNGSIWTPVNSMITDSSVPYGSYADDWDTLIGDFQIRFNSQMSGLVPPFNEDGVWTKNDPPATGTDRFWVRLRITSAITTSPIIQHVKLHTNRAEINADGWTEFFGTARPADLFPIDFGMSTAVTESGQQPEDVDLFVSDSLYLTRLGNGFRDNRIDLTSFNLQLPSDLDTSTKLLFIVKYVVDGAVAGNINWDINWSIVSPGGPVYDNVGDAPIAGPNEQILNLVDAIPTNGEDVERILAFTLDVSNGIPFRSDGSADDLWITIRRDGVSDTYSGRVSIINMGLRYIRWNLGSRFITT